MKISTKHVLLSGLLTLTFIGIADAAPITITQTFSNVYYTDFGVQSGIGYGQNITGDWIFTATTDTNSINQSTWPNGSGYYAATITLTQEYLGLYDEKIMNLNYLFITSNTIGFSKNINGGSPWTLTRTDSVFFSDPSAFPTEVKITDNTHSMDGFGPQWEGFHFENGSRLYGSGGAATSSVISAVPVPAAMWLLGSGLITLIGFARCKK